MALLIDIEKCIGCGGCVAICPYGALSLVDDKVVLGDGCTLCGSCVPTCAYDALAIEETAAEAAPAAARGVWVFAEQFRGAVRSVAYELLSRGRELADPLETALAAVCF